MDLLSELQHAEFKEAFDEFDKVRIDWWRNYFLPVILKKRVLISEKYMIPKEYTL